MASGVLPVLDWGPSLHLPPPGNKQVIGLFIRFRPCFSDGGRRSDPLVPGTHWVLKQQPGGSKRRSRMTQVLSQQPQLHVGAGHFWSGETCCHHGHCFWRHVPEQERSYHPQLGLSSLESRGYRIWMILVLQASCSSKEPLATRLGS